MLKKNPLPLFCGKAPSVMGDVGEIAKMSLLTEVKCIFLTMDPRKEVPNNGKIL